MHARMNRALVLAAVLFTPVALAQGTEGPGTVELEFTQVEKV